MARVSVVVRDGKAAVIVDDHDITRHILAEGFTIDLSDVPDRPALIRMTLAATEIDLDLPDATIEAMRVERALCEDPR